MTHPPEGLIHLKENLPGRSPTVGEPDRKIPKILNNAGLQELNGHRIPYDFPGCQGTNWGAACKRE